MMELLKRFGGMLVAPRPTLRRIIVQDAGELSDVVLLLVFIQLLASCRTVYRNALLFFEAPSMVSSRLLHALWSGLQHLTLVAAVAAFLLALLFHYAVKPKLSARTALTVVGYALVPMSALALVGLVARAFGTEVWWLPHTAVDNRFIVVQAGQVSWVRFITKCVVNYGVFALLLLDLVHQLRQPKPEMLPEMSFPPRAVPDPGPKALMGTAILGVLMAAATAGSVVDVVQASTWLRPALPGDALPLAKLPWLNARQRKHRKKALDLGALKGKVVLLDFWASWCAPCRRALPDLDQLSRDLKDQGLVVVGINREPRNREAARAFVSKAKLRFDMVVDDKANTQGGYGEHLGLQSLPTTVLVDRKGKIVRLHLGYTDPQQVRAEVEKLLKQSLLEPITRSD